MANWLPRLGYNENTGGKKNESTANNQQHCNELKQENSSLFTFKFMSHFENAVKLLSDLSVDTSCLPCIKLVANCCTKL